MWSCGNAFAQRLNVLQSIVTAALRHSNYQEGARRSCTSCSATLLSVYLTLQPHPLHNSSGDRVDYQRCRLYLPQLKNYGPYHEAPQQKPLASTLTFALRLSYRTKSLTIPSARSAALPLVMVPSAEWSKGVGKRWFRVGTTDCLLFVPAKPRVFCVSSVTSVTQITVTAK